MLWANRHVVVGVTGGIACYKSCYLVRRLVEAGAQVDVILTRGAAEFVTPVTFEALTGRPVFSSLWEPGRALAHVQLGRSADLFIVAPATAHTLARIRHGFADDFLTAAVLAAQCPVVLAPAMNDAMFAAPPTVENVAELRSRGMTVVGPEGGPLAEGAADRPGRMSEPDTILAYARRAVASASPLVGRRVVVTAGPTRESLDPVRVITNRSSGKMGYRLAEAAWQRGANVLLISGPSGEAVPIGVEFEAIESTADLHGAVQRALPAADVLIMAAAPADYRPSESTPTKRPRQQGPVSLSFEPTVDILVATQPDRKPGAVVVGFALETGLDLGKAKAKLERKGLDFVVGNDALEPGAGFEVDTNRVLVLGRDGFRREFPLASKSVVAEQILDLVETKLG
ncbi:MAG: bifunctional phosphopantothenoylcysteine decarboxylase/phosphopantothenate--cysteine ligase CoaBC [Gemmatimonadetes bacterium]|nr:bifunctional phosphopantothenoylcysteine decarboxylase/phosphopantothenate--cysteine ligase CoaBC [Gemmatimonadota bacterium]